MDSERGRAASNSGAAAVNDIALPILDQDRAAYHKAVRSFQAHKVTDMRRRLRIAWCVTAAMMLAVIGLSAAVTVMQPLQRLVPLFIVVRDDGTVDSAVSLSGLPLETAQRAIRAAIWRYVSERESYSFSEAKYRYDLVSAMSGAEVQKQFQQWFLLSPDSPQKTIGKKGQSNVQEISMSFIRDGVALVRFWKTTQLYGEKEQKSSWTATVQFEMADAVPENLLLNDPVGLRVIRYQVEENSP
jgi:type IV secretion system protein VirB8